MSKSLWFVGAAFFSGAILSALLCGVMAVQARWTEASGFGVLACALWVVFRRLPDPGGE